MNITFGSKISVTNYNKLRTAVGWKAIHPELAQNGLDNASFLIVVNDNDTPIGMARVITDYGYILFIADVIVLPEYQGNGIGGEIMSRVMEYINNTTNDGQGRFINLMAAKGKEGFYKKFGFEERPNERLGPGMTQWFSKQEVFK